MFPFVFAALAASKVAAAPDGCSLDQAHHATCEGDQSHGVAAGQDLDQTDVQTIFLESTTPVSGTSSGIRWDVSGNNTQNNTSIFVPSPTPSVTAASGPAMCLTSGGGNDGNGRGVNVSPAYNVISNGGTDGAVFAQTIGPNGSSKGFDNGSGSAGGTTWGTEVIPPALRVERLRPLSACD